MKPYCLLISLCLLLSCAGKNEKANNDQPDSAKANVSETENQELAQRQAENDKAFSEMGKYDGEYKLFTESDAADGALVLKYLGDQKFKVSLKLSVPNVCNGVIEDTAIVDRTQHAFFAGKECMLHFELLDREIEINEPEGCVTYMNGDCSFAGTYKFSR